MKKQPGVGGFISPVMNVQNKNNYPHFTRTSPAKSDVAVLLCTYNGERFLPAQLRSLEDQTYPSWTVLASDDGSSDNTPAILEDFQSRWGAHRLALFSGPRKGFVANFFSLLRAAGSEHSYFAFCDQDDIWERDKLERAVHQLRLVPPDVPALYCSRTRLVDEQGAHLGYSPLFTRPPCFANALVQSIAGGNTMVLNRALRELLVLAGPAPSVVSHDWLTYQVVTGCGGEIFYDAFPTVRYRQHVLNLVGRNSTFMARFKRMRMLLGGDFRSWNNQNIEVLKRIRPRLTSANQEIFDLFCDLRYKDPLSRLKDWKRSGIHRQTFLENIGLLVAMIINKI